MDAKQKIRYLIKKGILDFNDAKELGVEILNPLEPKQEEIKQFFNDYYRRRRIKPRENIN